MPVHQQAGGSLLMWEKYMNSFYVIIPLCVGAIAYME
jgi:hypothetical protein